ALIELYARDAVVAFEERIEIWTAECRLARRADVFALGASDESQRRRVRHRDADVRADRVVGERAVGQAVMRIAMCGADTVIERPIRAAERRRRVKCSVGAAVDLP